MEHLQNFNEILEEKTREVQEIVYEYLPVEAGFASELAKAMNYSMTAGGKRIRPLLMQESYQLFGGRGTDVYPFMAAIEMIHTHSLIHDDLPAIDNDEYRRGRKTTHVVFGEAMGVLAG
ncbi:MAG: polyprenyl synthetase family protein, partial [Fusicatenibacter sp.]|nr:polyprenyl synthetase family protein [Fusicatenibacter sp.]